MWGILVGGTENAGHPHRAPVSTGGEKSCTGEHEGPCRMEFQAQPPCFTDGRLRARERQYLTNSFSQPASHSFHQHLFMKSLAADEGHPLFCSHSARKAASLSCVSRGCVQCPPSCPVQVWHIVGLSCRSRTPLSKVTPGDHATTAATTIFLLPHQHARQAL